MTNDVTIDPVSPGELLDEEFLRPLGISPHRFAEDIDASPQEIAEIIRGQEDKIDPENDPRWWYVAPVRSVTGIRRRATLRTSRHD